MIQCNNNNNNNNNNNYLFWSAFVKGFNEKSAFAEVCVSVGDTFLRRRCRGDNLKKKKTNPESILTKFAFNLILVVKLAYL